MAVPKFEYFPTRAAFDTARGATTVFNNSVVFIEDTMELFTHGHFWTVSNLSQYYNSSTQKLQLKNGSTVISELDASPFIKDGMLDSVELITTPEGSTSPETITYTPEGEEVESVTMEVRVLDATEFDTVTYNGTTITLLPEMHTQYNDGEAYSIINCSANMIVASTTMEYEDDDGFLIKFDVTPKFCNQDGNGEVLTNATAKNGTWLHCRFPYSLQVDGNTIHVEQTSGVDYYVDEPDGTIVSNGGGSNYPTLPYLKFTFNTFNGEPTHTVIKVSISELFTAYNGDNVLLSSNYAKAQTYVEPAVGDKVDIAVGKLAKGVADNAAAIATKQAVLTGAATSIAADNLTASKALVSDANGKVAVSSVTATELGYLSGTTQNIQTQLNAKANISDLGWVEHN